MIFSDAPSNAAGIHYLLSIPLSDGTTYVTSVSKPDQINVIVRRSQPSGDVVVDEWHRGNQYKDGPVLGWKHWRRYVWH